jgi:helix-turn-helix protein
MSATFPGSTAKGVGLRLGQPFNPYRMFVGLFIPEGLARSSRISAGAKLAWGRLARYSGVDGRCHPTMKTLGEEIGVGERQAQKYVSELERNELIRRVKRFSGRGQTSNAFEFLWHELFEEGANDTSGEGVNNRSGEGVNDRSGEGVNDRSPKESQSEESHNIDLDFRRANRKNRDSRPGLGAVWSACKKYPRLREALADYMTTPDDRERVSPPERLVVDVMDAAAGATEVEVIECLDYLRNERGLRHGTKHGPRRFAWFKSVVADYFRQKRHREEVYAPPEVPWDRRNGAGPSQEELDSMTDAIEVPEL